MTKDLNKFKDELVSFLKNEGFVVFYGSYLSGKEESSSVYWDNEVEQDYKQFLRVAKDQGIKTIYISTITFEESDIEECLGDLSEEEDINEETVQTRKKLERFRNKIGELCQLYIFFLKDGIPHFFVKSADWYEEFNELAKTIESLEEKYEEEIEEPSEEEIEQYAKKLAYDPGFQKATKNVTRDFVVRKMFGDELYKKNIRTSEVINGALAIYELEIKPKIESEQKKKILELKGKGLTNIEIAGKLGLPINKIPYLLSKE